MSQQELPCLMSNAIKITQHLAQSHTLYYTDLARLKSTLYQLSKQSCRACTIDHPSQSAHQRLTGCMADLESILDTHLEQAIEILDVKIDYARLLILTTKTEQKTIINY
eukprot:GHVU01109627.1.p1 GENE.GHVU01109627.1~~GHVU01109627.1.p1  ORF type:complete len:109 (+),score=3.06 GHVU01109627.1:190-516(+)